MIPPCKQAIQDGRLVLVVHLMKALYACRPQALVLQGGDLFHLSCEATVYLTCSNHLH
jgi:hypothetical protein